MFRVGQWWVRVYIYISASGRGGNSDVREGPGRGKQCDVKSQHAHNSCKLFLRYSDYYEGCCVLTAYCLLLAVYRLQLCVMQHYEY